MMWKRTKKKKKVVLFYPWAPEQEKADTNTYLSSKPGHKNVVVIFSILEVADSWKYEHSTLQPLKFFLLEKL